MRDYWKLKKRESSKIQTAQQKRRVKEYDPNRKDNKDSDDEPPEKKKRIDSEGNGFSSRCAEKKATQRLRQSYPKSPSKMANIFANIISSSTPE